MRKVSERDIFSNRSRTDVRHAFYIAFNLNYYFLKNNMF